MTAFKIIQTADGSHTLFSEQFNAHYHSLNGAIQESLHIFIKCGLEYISLNDIHILEVGFGTGLNAALTATRAINKKLNITYTGIDLYPLNEETLSKLNYGDLLGPNDSESWKKIISLKWGKEKKINDFFLLNKIEGNFVDINLTGFYNLIYFDAFAPDDQPELWSETIFNKIYQATTLNGVFITYCSKGIVKQALRKTGFFVERLPGPKGKRHIIRAIKR